MKDLIAQLLSPEFYTQLIDFLGPFGFLVGILMTFIEAFIPPIPLAVLTTINVITFGFVQGYALSYIGTVLGSYTVFILLEKLDRKFFGKYIERHPKFKSLLIWIHEKGIFPIFILLTFPFTPSIIVAILAALADLEREKYLLALVGGKLIMVLSLSFIGYNVESFLRHPIRSSVFIVLTFLVTYMAKLFLSYYEKKVLRKKHEI